MEHHYHTERNVHHYLEHHAHPIAGLGEEYNENSINQNQMLDLSKPLIELGAESYCAELPPPGQPFIIGDFGAGTGANSAHGVSMIINALRQKYGFEKLPSIIVVQDDIPRNNWDVLFDYNLKNEASLTKLHKGVLNLASGVSFYQQVLPKGYLHFGLSSCTLHWLSKLPAKMDKTFGDDEAFIDMLNQQAAKDWQSFITARSMELVKGGILVVDMPTCRNVTVTMYKTCYKAAEKLIEQGIMKPEELLEFQVPYFWRSLDEIKSHTDLYDKLNLEVLWMDDLPAVNHTIYESFLEHKNVMRFADDYATALEAVHEQFFLDCLGDKSDEEKEKISIKFWDIVQDYIAENPEEFAPSWTIMGAVFRKRC